MISFWMLLEAALVAITCSIDVFAASFAYGSDRIRMPLPSLLIVNLICSLVLGLSLCLGALVRRQLPLELTLGICFSMLLLIGLCKLLDSFTKSLIRKYNGLNKKLQFSLFNLKCILSLYADPEQADRDGSRDISPKEAVFLAISLSIDGLALGFGAAVGNIDGGAVFAASLLSNMAAAACGSYLGRKAAAHLPGNISWLSGLIIIAIAISKLL